MLKFQMIGYLGRDCIVQQHGTESVINFSLCHTDKYKDESGQKHERATWVSCSWWVESINIAQYLRKGTLIWAEGVPEAKIWKDKKGGDSKAFLNMRVQRVELLSGKKENESNNVQQGFQSSQAGDDDLPF